MIPAEDFNFIATLPLVPRTGLDDQPSNVAL